jgi:serine protease Do
MVLIFGSVEVWEYFRNEIRAAVSYVTGKSCETEGFGASGGAVAAPPSVSPISAKTTQLNVPESQNKQEEQEKLPAVAETREKSEEAESETPAAGDENLQITFAKGFENVAKKVKHAVVNVATLQVVENDDRLDFPDIFRGGPFDDLMKEFFDCPKKRHRKRRTNALGSGFIVKIEQNKAYVVTNYHVVENATKVVVFSSDKTELKADVFATDSRTDLAVLAVNIEGLNLSEHQLTTVTWGDSDKLREGNFVIAIGNPFGLGSTVTHGIVSAKGRNISFGRTSINFVEDFIQHSAPINMGNSGGCLLDVSGRVVGINNAIFSTNGGNIGIGFAIPSNIARTTVEQLIQHKRTYRGWFGAEVHPMEAKQAESIGLAKNVLDPTKVFGAFVSKLVPGGPAEKAGIKVGDIVLEFNGKKITEEYSLQMAVGTTEIGKSVPVTVWRQTDDGKWTEVKVSVKVGDFEKALKAGEVGDAEKERITDDKKDTEVAVDPLGIHVASLPKQYKEDYPAEVKVVVTKVDEEKTVTFYGPVFMVGDGFITANNKKVTSASQFKKIIDEVIKNKETRNHPVPFIIVRGGSRMMVATTLDTSIRENKKETGKAEKEKKTTPTDTP